MDNKETNWAPERIYLQREQGEQGSHTWCEDSVGDDMIEEVAYVRADAALSMNEAIALRIWEAAMQFDTGEDGMEVAAYERARDAEILGILAAAPIGDPAQEQGAQDVARVALNDEQRRDIQECIDYLTPAAKDFSDLGMVGMGDSKHARCIRVLRSLLAPQPPQAGASAPPYSAPFTTDVPQCCGEPETCDTPCAPAAPAFAAPAPAEPKGEQQADHEAKGTIDHLDLDNHRLRRAMQKIMARLAELLDEDQFANIESIVKGVGVEPPEQPAARNGEDGYVCPAGKAQAQAEQRAATLFCDLKSDADKSNFFLSGRAYETGVIARAIQNDVAMAYHRCAEYAKQRAANKDGNDD
jgi:hypothetical protein